MSSNHALSRPTVVTVVNESIWKLTHVIDDPAEFLVDLKHKKKKTVYLLAIKLSHSELPFVLVGIVRRANRLF